MARLAASVAAIRVAVRRTLTRVRPDGPVLVACSGGADSLALAAATVFVAPRLGLSVGLVTVDHGLQAGSAQRAATVAKWATEAGFAPVEVATVTVDGRPGGPEAAAREARYQALTEAARRHGATAVLLGHTRDDQAETVLLALARGAGPRGLAGMPVQRELDGTILLRPLLGVGREQTRAACTVLGLTAWDDPHNSDPAYTRARVRGDLMPVLTQVLGAGAVDNLARTARLVAEDNATLDSIAAAAFDTVRSEGGLSVPGLVGLLPAIRTRVLHAWCRELGASPAALSSRHIAALDALVTAWHGQGPVALPGGGRVARQGGVLVTGAEPDPSALG
ncbi:tRNA lysidine(34) synthetase TilS [Micromonospora sp. NPDC003197]